jgi:hypothetical protein
MHFPSRHLLLCLLLLTALDADAAGASRLAEPGPGKSVVSFDIDTRLCTDKASSWAANDADEQRLFYQCMAQRGHYVPQLLGVLPGRDASEIGFRIDRDMCRMKSGAGNQRQRQVYEACMADKGHHVTRGVILLEPADALGAD